MVVFHVHTSVAEDVVGDAGGVDDSDVAGDLEKARNAESVAAAAMVEERVYFHISVHKASWQIMLAASWVMLAALLDVEDVEDDLGARGMSAGDGAWPNRAQQRPLHPRATVT